MADMHSEIDSIVDEIRHLFAFLGASLGLAPVRVDDGYTGDFVRHGDAMKR